MFALRSCARWRRWRGVSCWFQSSTPTRPPKSPKICFDRCLIGLIPGSWMFKMSGCNQWSPGTTSLHRPLSRRGMFICMTIAVRLLYLLLIYGILDCFNLGRCFPNHIWHTIFALAPTPAQTRTLTKNKLGYILFSCHTTHDTLRSGYTSTLIMFIFICVCIICKSTVCSTCIRFLLRACLALVDVYCCVT